MSTLREKIEKKKNKYLEAAKNIGKSKPKKEDDEEKAEGSEAAVDEVDDSGAESLKSPDTPSRTRNNTAPSNGTPAKEKTDKEVAKDEKAKEKEIWKYEGEFNAEGEVCSPSFPSPYPPLVGFSFILVFVCSAHNLVCPDEVGLFVRRFASFVLLFSHEYRTVIHTRCCHMI
jgi:hypothetical protein